MHDVACRVDRPVHELKGFAKAELDAGETHTVQLELDPSSFAFWSVQAGRWVVEAGEFEIRVGFSSRDIEATARITLPGDEPIPTLTPMSTIGEWLIHPTGGPVLMEAMKAAGAEGVPPELAAMAADMPICKLVSFGFGLSQEQLDGLLQAAAPPVSG